MSSSQNRENSLKDQRKLALIIGNNNYQHMDKLKLSIKDAELMESTLTKLGFSTTTYKNSTNEELKNNIRNFGDKLESGDIIFFYYSGHAGQQSVNNLIDNYLFGIDAQEVVVDGSSSVEKQKKQLSGVSFHKVLYRAFAEDAIYLIVLDACRVTPSNFLKYKGGVSEVVLAEQPELSLNISCAPEDIKRGEFDIVYACQPGYPALEDSTREYGFLATALAHNMLKPQKWTDALIDVIDQVWNETEYRQKPQICMNISRKIYFLTQEPATYSGVQGDLLVTIYEVSGVDKSGTHSWDVDDFEGFVKVEMRGSDSSDKQSTRKVKFFNNTLVFNEEVKLEVRDKKSELRILVCYHDPKIAPKTRILAACGFYFQDIIDAVPVHKHFELFGYGTREECGYINLKIDYSRNQNCNAPS